MAAADAEQPDAVSELVSGSAALVAGKPPAARAVATWLQRFDALPVHSYPAFDESNRGWTGPGDVDRLLATRPFRRPDPEDAAARQRLRTVLRLSHANGYIREEAVRDVELSRGVTALLLVRSAEWVGAVRRAAVARLREAPDGLLLDVLPLAFRLARRDHGDELAAFLQEHADEPLLRLATAHADRLTRRSAWQLIAASGWLTGADIAELAGDPDQANRRLAAAGIDTLPTDARRRVAAGLVNDPVGGIAVTGLRVLVELDGDAPITAALESRNVGVRWTAQRLATRRGLDPREWYCTRLRTAPDDRVALLGFAELAKAEDLDDLHHLLIHPEARVRSAALRAIGWYDAPAARAAALAEFERLDASRALRAAARILSADGLTADEAAALSAIILSPKRPPRGRAAALRLTRPRRWLNLSIALQLAAQRGAAPQQLGSDELDRWLRDSAVLAGRPTDAERAVISDLLPRLDERRRQHIEFVLPPVRTR